MASSELFQALSMFNQGVSDLQTSRALTQANEAVRQVKNSELEDHEKTQQLRSVAEGLTLELARFGHPAEAAKAVATAFKPETPPLIQSYDQAMVYGSPGQRKLATQAEAFKTDEKIRLKGAPDGKEPGGGDPMKNFFKEQTAFSMFDKNVSPDSQRTGSLAQSAKTVERGNNLQALIGNGTDLNKLPRVQVTEIASAMAQMVMNGAVTEGELKMFYPDTIGMDLARKGEYIANRPLPANQADFVKLYQKAAYRESSLASNRIQESILSKATANSKLTGLSPTAESRFKETVAAKMNQYGWGGSADDVQITPSGKVTTTDWQKRDNKLAILTAGVKEAKLALKSDDAASAKKARDFFSRLGVSEKMASSEIQQVLKYRVISEDL